jgi:hypothetical protein
MVREAGFEPQEIEAMMHCPRMVAVLASNACDRFGSPRLKAALPRSLMRWERLARWPTRYLTGYFIALKAVRE